MIKGLERYDASLVSISKTIDVTLNVDDGHEWSEVIVRVKTHYDDESGLTNYTAELPLGDFSKEEITKLTKFAIEYVQEEVNAE